MGDPHTSSFLHLIYQIHQRAFRGRASPRRIRWRASTTHSSGPKPSSRSARGLDGRTEAPRVIPIADVDPYGEHPARTVQVGVAIGEGCPDPAWGAAPQARAGHSPATGGGFVGAGTMPPILEQIDTHSAAAEALGDGWQYRPRLDCGWRGSSPAGWTESLACGGVGAGSCPQRPE